MEQQLGRYQIEKLLGEGSFAQVYQAVDVELERRVALKVLKPIWLSDPQALARFKQEAKTMARLHHPHIATVYEVGEARGQVYLVQFLVEGETLAVRLARRRLTWSQMLNVLRSVASALDYAHQQDIVHRDVKPSNILLDQTDRAYLSDFGLVRAAERSVALSTSVGGLIGTPPYMGPELWEDAPATAATDVYALSCVVIEMLTGQVLFGSSTSAGVMRQHLITGPEFPTEWPEDVPPGVAQVLQQGLAKAPGDRIGSAGELTARLEGLAKPIQPIVEGKGDTNLPALAPPEVEEAVLWLVSSAGQSYELKPGRLTLGWAANCDIKVVDPLASRQHTILDFDGRRCTIYDQESNNGTYINGQRLGPGGYPFSPGDQLTIGQTYFSLSQTKPATQSMEQLTRPDGDQKQASGAGSTLPLDDLVEADGARPKVVKLASSSPSAPTWPLSPPPAAPAENKPPASRASRAPARSRASGCSKRTLIVALAGGGLALLAIVCALIAMSGGSQGTTPVTSFSQEERGVEAALPTPTRVDPETTIQTYLDSGLDNYVQGNYDQALADFSQAIDLDPNSAFARGGRGYVYLAQGSYEQALTEFDQATELAPDLAFAYIGRGDVYTVQDNYEQAITEYSTAIELEPGNALAYGERGNVYVINDNYTQALADFNKALELDPDDPSASGWRGFVDFINGDYDQAIINLDEALERYPNWAFAYVWRGEAHRIQGDSGKAFADLNRAIELKPDLAYAYANRGYLYAFQKDYERASADFQYALTLNPTMAFAYVGQGYVDAAKGNYDQAIADLDRAIELSPYYAYAYDQRGRVYVLKEDYEQAFYDYIEAIELDDDNAAYYNSVCWYGSLLQLSTEVIDICNMAVELAPDDERAFYRDSRGVALALTGDYVGAIEDFNSLVEWSKQNGQYQEYGPLREDWIATLAAGQNPFDEATLKELLKGIKK